MLQQLQQQVLTDSTMNYGEGARTLPGTVAELYVESDAEGKPGISPVAGSAISRIILEHSNNGNGQAAGDRSHQEQNVPVPQSALQNRQHAENGVSTNHSHPTSGNDPPSLVIESDGVKDPEKAEKDPEEPRPPHRSLLELFGLFLWFGCNAFGGPAVQIGNLKERLVVKDKWISQKRFNRVFAVYQALPGPEAMELCCFFGLICRGRLGGFVGGMGFLLPGFCLCMLFAWLYLQFNLFQNEGFLRSFNCVRAVIPALIVRATHRIGEGILNDHETKQPNPVLVYYACFGALLTVFNTPFFITIAYTGLVHVLHHTLWQPRFNNNWLAIGLTTLAVALNVIYIALYGIPSGMTTASGLTTGSLHGTLFITGLLGGLLSFGGAYTAIPFVRQSMVVASGWMTDGAFLDGIALVNCLPTPLVMFVCFDGFYVERMSGWSGVGGAVLMTLGMFIPAFSFTILGHDFFERATDHKLFNVFLDGVAAGVLGLIVQTSWTLIQAGVRIPMDAIVFCMGLMIMYTYKHRLTSTAVIALAALSGQVLYTDLAVDVAWYEHLHGTTTKLFNFTQYGIGAA